MLVRISQIKGNKISNSRLREEVFNILLDDATEAPSTGKYYTFEYDPKFADKLKENEVNNKIKKKILKNKVKGPHVYQHDLLYLRCPFLPSYQ